MVKDPNRAQGYPSSDWPKLDLLVTHLIKVVKIALKMRPDKGKK